LTFLSPLGFLLLLGVPLLVLLHLFRQERKRREVSSIFLWKEIQDQHSRRIRPNLLRNINLILQILAVIAASLALSRPITTLSVTSPADELIVAIDTSASMLAREGSTTRMDLATDRATEIIGDAGRDTRIMLISAGADPSVAHGYTTDRNSLGEALENMEATEGQGEIAATLDLVESLAFGSSTEVVLITDGAFELPPGVVLPGNLTLSFVGSDIGNRGITAFELRSRPDGSAIEAYIQIANFSVEPATVELQIQVDRDLATRQSIDMAAGERHELALALQRRTGATYTAQLIDNEDPFPADDRAYAVTRGSRPVRVQLVTAGNVFLESFLTVYPNLDLTVTPVVDRSQPFDVLILDQVAAPERLTGNVVALGSFPPDGPFIPAGFVEPEQAIATVPNHPVMQSVHFEETDIRSVTTGVLSPRASVVASSGPFTLVYAMQSGALKMVGTTFALSDTDLPLRSGFPVLMHNIIEWLAPVAPAGDVGYNRVGGPIGLYVPVGEELVVARPDGVAVHATPRVSPYLFTRANTSGIYGVIGESFVDRFAVSLASAEESNLTPRLVASDGASSGQGQTAISEGAPVWYWFALLAVLLLAAEWIIWARRT